MENSLASAPLMEMSLRFSVGAPPLVMVATCGSLGVPDDTRPKLRPCGVNKTVVLHAERLTTWGLKKPPLEGVRVTALFVIPCPPEVFWIPMSHCPPAGKLPGQLFSPMRYPPPKAMERSSAVV